MADTQIQQWHLNYVNEQQERAFKVVQALLKAFQGRDYEQLEQHFIVLLGALAAQAEMISVLAYIVSGEEPSEDLQNLLGSNGSDLDSTSGSTSS